MKSNIFNKISLILKKKINILIILAIILITFFLKNYYFLSIKYRFINLFIFFMCILLIVIIINTYFFNIKNILQEINYERQNITWPTQKETLYTTLIIILISSFISIILWCLDNIIFYIISFITSIT
ncbi:Protein translocase subunit SecE [Buchnera aphidicola (Chaitophorus sp. 3695)]|uniref:preprotein translocase subunit SecE n=1 Tax=Buchnera aphidicola TaxID=9 RepID=UPI003463D5C3